MKRSAGSVKRWVFLCLLLVVVIAGAWLGWRSLRPVKGVYRTGAVIQEIWGKDLVLLKHDSIPGLMDESMSMAFFVESPEMLSGVKPGDRFRITLKETPGKLLIIKMEPLP